MGRAVVPVAVAGMLAGTMWMSCNGGNDGADPNEPGDPAGPEDNGPGDGNPPLFELDPAFPEPPVIFLPAPPHDEEMEPPTLDPGAGMHSALTAEAIASLRSIASRDPALREYAFAKIGDSHSVSSSFLQCFAEGGFDLGLHTHLLPAIGYFGVAAHEGVCSLGRESVATVAGIGAWGLMRDDPSLVEQELEAMRARFAVVMVGTNDACQGRVHNYVDNMLDMFDLLTRRGVIPLVSTLPPMADDRHLHVRRFNAMLKAMVSLYGLPLVDLYEAMLPLPYMGLRSDGVHLSVDWNRGGGMAACTMSGSGLAYGAHVRNLLTLEQLERARRSIIEGDVLDLEAEPRVGSGREEDPVHVDAMPFGEGLAARDSSWLPASELPVPCGADWRQDLGMVYEVLVEEDTLLHAILHARGGASGLVEIRAAGEASCVAGDEMEAVAEVAPGRYHVIIRQTPGYGGGGELLIGITSAP